MTESSGSKEEGKEKPEPVPAPERLPDRPLECSECRRPIAFLYTEMVGDSVNETCHCAECPVLLRRFGKVEHISTSPPSEETGMRLCCGVCGTTLRDVHMGGLLGCGSCYDVFGDVLVGEMLTSKRISPKVSKANKARPIHSGRALGEGAKINLSTRLADLNEALKETLGREDYEQAAWLRDQIKDLTEKGTHEREQ